MSQQCGNIFDRQTTLSTFVNTNSKLPEICKEAFTKAREKLGLSTKELGGMACLSTRQIEQIENGETSSYYGAQIKVTAAKKVARLLKLDEADAFDYGAPAPQNLTVSQSGLPIAEAKLVINPQDLKSEKIEVSQGDVVKDPAEIQVQPDETPFPTMVIVEEKKEPITEVLTKEVYTKEVPSSGVVSRPNPVSQKKLFLWLSVLGAIVFSVINLQPLLFADKPQEIIVVKEEIVEPAPPPVAATPAEPVPAVAPVAAIVAGAPGVCPAEEGVISYKPELARKPANTVYVQAKSQQVICVVDASGKIQNKLLEPGVGALFNGKPPYKLLTDGLSQMDIYFQGSKVRLSNPNTKTLLLEASEVTAPPSDQMDSQQR
jgi:transcriptional regulator with XRE-family HTH domain